MKALNFDKALAAAKSPVSNIMISLTTNQADGISSYANGKLYYREGHLDKRNPPARSPAALTTNESWLSYMFSDRESAIAIGVGTPGGFGPSTIAQPFYVKASDELGVSLTRINSTTVRANFELHTWKTKFAVDLKEFGDVLLGVGAPVGNSVSQAVYVVAFTLGPIVK